jgi:hypothetical protein
MPVNLTEYAAGNAPGEQSNPVIPAVRNTVLVAGTPVLLDPRTSVIRLYNDGTTNILVGMDVTATLTPSTAELLGPGQQIFHSVLSSNIRVIV